MKGKSLQKSIVRFLLIAIMSSASVCYAREIPINQLNANNKKEGFWIEEDGSSHFRRELYYKNGIRHGFYKSYRNGRLRGFGEYKDGKMVGTWYDFGDSGELVSLQNNFTENKDTFVIDGYKILYPYRCYMILYYPNGNKKSEGIILWEEDPMMDTSQEIGEWKYYTEEGELKDTQVYNYKKLPARSK